MFSHSTTWRKTLGVIALTILSGIFGGGRAEEPNAQPKIAKLDESREMAIESGEARSFILPAQAGVQTLTVEFTSTKFDVTAYVFKGTDIKENDWLTADPKKALATARAIAGTIKVEVPAKTETHVVFRGATGKTTVATKISNQLTPNAKEVQIKKLEDENAALKREIAELKKKLEKR